MEEEGLGEAVSCCICFASLMLLTGFIADKIPTAKNPTTNRTIGRLIRSFTQTGHLDHIHITIRPIGKTNTKSKTVTNVLVPSESPWFCMAAINLK